MNVCVGVGAGPTKDGGGTLEIVRYSITPLILVHVSSQTFRHSFSYPLVDLYSHLYVYEWTRDHNFKMSLQMLKRLAVAKRVEALTKRISKVSIRHLQYGFELKSYLQS